MVNIQLALIINRDALDDMVTLRGLDQAGHLALLERERRLIERLEHLALDKDVTVRIACQAGVLADFIHHIFEVLARVQAVKHLLRRSLGFLVRTGLAGHLVIQGNQDMLCGDGVALRIGLLELRQQFFIRRVIHTVFAVVIVLQHLVARADIRHVGIQVRGKAGLRQHQVVQFFTVLVNGVLHLALQFLLLCIAQLQAGFVKFLLDHMGRNNLVIGCGLRHLAQCGRKLLVIPNVGQAKAGIHIGVILHVVIHHARILIRTDFLSVDRHDDRRIALDIFVVDGRTADAPHGSAHSDRHHHDQRGCALY